MRSAKLLILAANARLDLILLMEFAHHQLKKLKKTLRNNGPISRKNMKEIMKMQMNKKKEETFSGKLFN